MRYPRTIVGLSAVAVLGAAAIAATMVGGPTPVPTAIATMGSSTAQPAGGGPTITPAPSTNEHPPPGTATIHTATATVDGARESILENDKGLPLYFYRPDTATTSMVTGTLAALWPPLEVSAPTVGGASGTLKVRHTSNGRQVSYNGHFLYTFVEDGPGRVTGQGVQDFFVATPRIGQSQTAAPPGWNATPAPTTNGGGY